MCVTLIGCCCCCCKELWGDVIPFPFVKDTEGDGKGITESPFLQRIRLALGCHLATSGSFHSGGTFLSKKDYPNWAHVLFITV